MMPYIQGSPDSVPTEYRMGYEIILASVFAKKGDIGYLTIDESRAAKGNPHRGMRAKWGRALHTEAGRHPDKQYAWGGLLADILSTRDILIDNFGKIS